MDSPFAAGLEARGYVVLDGALATELENRGCDLDDPLWSARTLLETPDRIEEVHLDYLRAGAEVATTASYQATFEALGARGVDHAGAREVLRRSVAIARAACRRHGSGLVAASIGPYGAFLHDGSEYTGDYPLEREALADFHRERLRVLTDAGPDLVAFETIPSLTEAGAIVSLLEESSQAPAWLSFSCRSESESSRGDPIEACVELASSSPSVVAVGFNCTHPRFIEGLVIRARAVTHRAIAVYPNSGESWDGKQHRWTGRTSRDRLEHRVRRWRELGAELFGGCCRTTPETIAGIASALASSG